LTVGEEKLTAKIRFQGFFKNVFVCFFVGALLGVSDIFAAHCVSGRRFALNSARESRKGTMFFQDGGQVKQY
jgi:hypothetical protein